GPKVFNECVGRCHQAQQRNLGIRMPEIEHDGALVAGIGFPVKLVATVTPVSQRIARRRLDLNDVRAKIGQLQRQHVAGDEAREIEHPDAIERASRGGVEFDWRYLVGVLHCFAIDPMSSGSLRPVVPTKYAPRAIPSATYSEYLAMAIADE